MEVKRTTVLAHPSNYYTGRRGHVQFIVIHDGETNEGPTAAEGMASWFAQKHPPGQASSAHRAADTDSICTCVRDQDTAFGAPGVNSTGWHLEHAGRAGQTASQWDDAASRLILANGALAAAEACERLAPLTVDRKPIPAVWLTDAQLRAAQSDPRVKGFVTHRQVSRVLGGTHTDPGANFPLDRYMQLVRSHLANPTGGFLMALTDEQQAGLVAGVEFIKDRLSGIFPQNYLVVDDNGVARSVPEGTPGSRPARGLDELAGNYIVRLILAGKLDVDDLAAKVAAKVGGGASAADIATELLKQITTNSQEAQQ